MRHGPSVYGRLQSLVQGRSVCLLVSLLILVAIGPWLTEHLVGRGLWELLFTLVTLSSVHMLSVKRGQALISGLLALPTLASLWLRQLVPAVGLSQVALVLLTLFLLYTTVTVLLRVFAEETVTMDTLSAALCVYLLMGYIWGSLYGLIYLRAPGAFHLPMGWAPAKEHGIATDVPMNLMTYFSFTTLTTLGYGDVLPVEELVVLVGGGAVRPLWQRAFVGGVSFGIQEHPGAVSTRRWSGIRGVQKAFERCLRCRSEVIGT